MGPEECDGEKTRKHGTERFDDGGCRCELAVGGAKDGGACRPCGILVVVGRPQSEQILRITSSCAVVFVGPEKAVKKRNVKRAFVSSHHTYATTSPKSRVH